MAAICLVFSGPINHPATTRLRNAICGALNGGLPGQNNIRCEKLFLLMNSPGGSLEDGFSIYNLLRTMKIEVVTVNMGQIASIANVPFLGGRHRIACPHAYFHFHNFDWNYPAAHTLTRQQFTDHSQLIDIARSMKKALLKEHTKLTDADFESLKLLDQPLVKDATFAKDKGIVQEIGFPDIPTGTPILNVDY